MVATTGTPGDVSKVIIYGLFFFLLSFFLVFFLFLGGSGGGFMFGIGLIGSLGFIAVFVYPKLSRWYRGAKPKLSKVGHFIVIINFVCIAFLFSYLFIVSIAFVSLVSAGTYYYPEDWWGYGVFNWDFLFVIDLGVLFCSAVSWLLYLRLGNKPKPASIVEKIMSSLIAALTVFMALFIFVSTNYWGMLTYYFELFFVLPLLMLIFLLAAFEYHLSKKRALPSIDKIELILISGVLTIIGAIDTVPFPFLDPYIGFLIMGEVCLVFILSVYRLNRFAKRSKLGP
jgi:hypothetical protein